MHKKYNIQMEYTKSVLWTSCVVMLLRDVSIAQQLLTQASASNQQGAGSEGQKEQRSLQRRFKEGRRGGAGKIGNKRKGEGGSSQKKAEKANTEKKVQDLQGKIKAKKEKTALAKGEKMKSADALRQNLRAAELARMTVERESKDLNDLP